MKAMLLRASLIVTILLSLKQVSLGNHEVGHELLQLHGSGTTNPSKCYWLILQQIMDRLRVPTHMTYRAVGSSTGQKEFKGTDSDLANPDNDWGSGDIPISSADYQAFTDNGVEIVHLPVVLGAISFFHSVPSTGQGQAKGLNLTSCLLAQIFTRQITFWDDDAIIAANPNLNLPYANFPITVARRRLGSSSTASITQYLRESCPEQWPANLVGKTIDWPEDTEICEGSAGMTACIRDREGTIGYIDSGHGISQNLLEIELRNADGNFLSSREARDLGGIGAAAAAVPSSASADFGEVDLLNRPGPNTWPIVAMSYVYVRRSLAHIDSLEERALLVAFLDALYNPTYIAQCEELFGFTRVPGFVRDVAMAGIQSLNVTSDAPTFTFEKDTRPNEGQGPYVVSAKRRSYVDFQQSQLEFEVQDLVSQNFQLRLELGQYDQTIQELRAELDIVKRNQQALLSESSGQPADEDMTPATSASTGVRGSAANAETVPDDDGDRIMAALAMGAVSIVLWGLAGIFVLGKFVFGCF